MTDEPSAPPPKLDPERLALRVQPRPVLRMSRRMIAAAVGVAGIGLAGAAIWSLSSRHAGPAAGRELYNVDRVQTAEGLERLPPDYRVTARTPPGVPQLGNPMPGDLGRPILRAQEEGRLDPTAPPAAATAADAERARRDQLRRERETVLRSDVLFQSQQGSRVAVAAPPLALADALAPGVAAAAPAAPPADGSQGAKRAFLAAEPDKRIYGNADLQTPRSPWQLMAGTVIPAALVTAISSDLPGQAIATVTANVYDGATGRHVLIPQGARLIGRYDSAVGYAQSRLLLVWDRLIFPDGSSILLDGLQGVDAQGRAGLKDRTDNHFDRLAGGALLATLLGVGADLGTDTVGADGSVVIALRSSAQDSVAQVGQEITRRNLDVQPTLTIRPGFPLRVLVQRDLVLRPVGQ